jgi:nucleotide-binding universal stress UspA family protein
VTASGTPQAPSDTDAALAAATRAAHAAGISAVTHTRREDPTHALAAVAEEHDADLLVTYRREMSGAPGWLTGSTPDASSRHPPPSILLVRTDDEPPVTGAAGGSAGE